MNRMIVPALLLALVLGSGVEASAQIRRHQDRGRNDDRIVIVLGGDRVTSQRARGPAFCRSGAGHPVHGRTWCWRKGFAPTGVVVRVPLLVTQDPRIPGSRGLHPKP